MIGDKRANRIRDAWLEGLNEFVVNRVTVVFLRLRFSSFFFSLSLSLPVNSQCLPLSRLPHLFIIIATKIHWTKSRNQKMIKKSVFLLKKITWKETMTVWLSTSREECLFLFLLFILHRVSLPVTLVWLQERCVIVSLQQHTHQQSNKGKAEMRHQLPSRFVGKCALLGVM